MKCPCWREVPPVFQIVRTIVPVACHFYAGVIRGMIPGRPDIPFWAPRCKRRFPGPPTLVYYARIAHSFENPALLPLLLREWQCSRPADLVWLFERDTSEAPVAGLTGPFTKDFFFYTNTRACIDNGSSRPRPTYMRGGSQNDSLTGVSLHLTDQRSPGVLGSMIGDRWVSFF